MKFTMLLILSAVCVVTGCANSISNCPVMDAQEKEDKGYYLIDSRDGMINSPVAAVSGVFYKAGTEGSESTRSNIAQDELQRVREYFSEQLSQIIDLHNAEFEELEKNLKLTLVFDDMPVAMATKSGDIVLGVRMVEAMYNSALVEAYNSDNFAIFGDDVNINFDRKVRQRDASLQQALRNDVGQKLRMMSDIELSCDDTLDRMFDGSQTESRAEALKQIWAAQSLISNVEATFVGVSRFVLAHELGHHVLNHHERLDMATFSTDSEYCRMRYGFELEADAYADALLSETGAPRYMHSRVDRGYYTFLNEVSHIIGYETLGKNVLCTYPDLTARRAVAGVDEQFELTGDNKALNRLIDQQYDRQFAQIEQVE